MANHPVSSVVWLCLIMSVYDDACMEPFQGKAGGFLGVCVKRESPSFVETAP